MAKFKHWIAAAVFIPFMSLAILGVLAGVGYLAYLLVANFPAGILAVGAAVTVMALMMWAGNYLDMHGMPWKRESESGESQ
jgi:hypothetical protein